MAEKKTSNMLVRDIPIEIWERIDRFCRRNNLKRRDFVELAIRYFEGDEAEFDRKQIQPSQFSPDIEGLESDIEILQSDIVTDNVEHKVEKQIDRSEHKNKVRIEQIKPEKTGLLKTTNLQDSGIGVPPSLEKKKGAMTTVYCWGLDRLGNDNLTH